MVAGFGLAAVALAGAIMDYVSWPLAAAIFVPSLGTAIWLRRRASQQTAKPAAVAQKVESGLRIVEKQLPAGKPSLRHGLRVTISTEVSVAHGLRVVCDVPIPEVEALAQTGRGSSARQGIPPAVRESRQAWLFVMRNSPGQREIFLRVDLFATQPIQVERVDQIRPGGKVALPALPEWMELEQGLDAGAEAPPDEPPVTTGEPATTTAPAGQVAAPDEQRVPPQTAGGAAAGGGNASPPTPAAEPAP
jgi:hypothetical protein